MINVMKTMWEIYVTGLKMERQILGLKGTIVIWVVGLATTVGMIVWAMHNKIIAIMMIVSLIVGVIGFIGSSVMLVGFNKKYSK